MAYRLELDPHAKRQLAAFDPTLASRILRKLVWFIEQPNPLHYTKMLHDSKLGEMRFRIGDYPATGYIDQKKKLIYIVAFGHRSEIYR